MTLVDRLHGRFGVEPILRVLEVPVSTFYGWVARRRHPSPRDIEEVWLGEQIERIHAESGETYGSPKVHAQLRREGIRVSRKRVERLMRQAGLQGAFMRKRKRGSTRRHSAATPAPDLVNRNLKADAPTGCGLPTSRASRPGRARCGWHVSATRSHGASWAGRRPTGPIPSRCWARWSTPCGAATSSESGSSSIATTARQRRFKGSSQHCLVGSRVAVR
jgi:hypothetical protein